MRLKIWDIFVLIICRSRCFRPLRVCSFRTEEEVAAIEKAALVIDIRERHFLSDFPKELKKLKKKTARAVRFVF